MNPIAAANSVSEWPKSCEKLPKPFLAAIDLFKHVQSINVSRLPTFDLKGVTPDNVDDLVLDLAQEISLVETTAKQGPLSKAKDQVLYAAASDLLKEANTAVSVLFKNLSSQLEEHAKEYVDAVSQLPDAEDVVTPQELFDASDVPLDALVDYDFSHIAAYQAAYQKAKSAAAAIDDLALLVASTRLTSENPVANDSVLLLLRPANAAELDKLDAAKRDWAEANPALKAINPLFFAAAKNGIQFGFNTPDQWIKLRQELS